MDARDPKEEEPPVSWNYWTCPDHDGMWSIPAFDTGDNGHVCVENEADVRRLAAAPEMLEVLERVRHNSESAWHVMGSKTREMVDAAIARARGGRNDNRR